MDMRRRGAAAAAQNVDEAAFRELLHQPGHVFRAFVVEAKFVGQAGVGIGADHRVGDARQLGQMRAHFASAERTIEADGERRGMLHRMPEGGRRLARQRTPGKVGDGARNHHRQRLADFLEHGFDAGIGGLGVQRVEDRLDDEDLGPAFDQRARRFDIGIMQLVERDGAEAGIVDVGRDRGGAAGRPERADDETPTAVLGFGLLRRFAAEPRGLAIELRHQPLHAVIGLRDRRGVEGVGGDQIGAGQAIGEVDVLDRLGLGQRQQIVVAAQVAQPVGKPFAAKLFFGETITLDHRAHRAVEHEDALLGGFGQRVADFGTVHREV